MREHYVMTVFYITIFVSLSFVYAKNALHMFQQQHYETNRYTKWLLNKNNIHFSNVFIYFILILIVFLLSTFNVLKELYCLYIALFITVIFTICVIYREAKKEYIKDLVVTSRVKRQIVVYTLLIIAFAYLFLLLKQYYLSSVVFVYVPYLLVYPMALITYPIEEAIKKNYENEARLKLDSFDHLKKIGITGSFGKTSTKNIVNDIISDNFFSIITPASYNTPMGITRTIREELRPIHEVFVCEMGADKVNDISYLMDFVKPQYGIVTSIGEQHLSTFKSLDNIIKEKMQEIELLPSNGVGFINVDNEYIADYHIQNKCKIVKVGIDNTDADYVAKNVKFTPSGSTFSVKISNKVYKFETSLLGKHNITNILIGIAVAIELGIPVKAIVRNVKNINQIEHRLQVKKINGFNVIDDAFNANPVGSKMSIDVLNKMPGKRIVITPGMIDLGKKQDELNMEFGKYMYGKVDYVVLVGEKQTRPIYNGLISAGFSDDKIRTFKSVRDAMHYCFTRFSLNDTILLENDLPDAFNV